MDIKARSEKRSSVITDLAYVLILLIKEKERSASALDIGNVQPTTSKKWMFADERNPCHVHPMLQEEF